MSPSKHKSPAPTSSRMKTTTRVYDMIEKEVNRLTGMMTLLSIILILSTVMLVISVIIIAAFRIEHFKYFCEE